MSNTTETSPRDRDFDLRGRSLRQHAARGVLINTGFTVAVGLVGLVRGFALAIFLTPEDYGIWGAVFVIVSMLLVVKYVGIGDKYVQQDEDDQELAFQKAFTLEALMTAIATLLVLAAAPLIAAIYDDSRLLWPTLAFALVLPTAPLQMPIAAYYRRMKFVSQSSLLAIEPVVVTVVSLGLAAAGVGYWSMFIGLLAGGWATAIVAVAVSPYKLRWRYDPGTLREYWSFSWPLLVATSGGVIMAAAAILAGNAALGLAGAGAMTLAANISAFANRVDVLVTGTLYPAICATVDKLDVLRESFVKSNRLALIWGIPFGFGLTLFGEDLVHFVLGAERWESVVILLQVYGLTAAFGQIGFNWDAYYRARGQTRPLAVAAGLTAGSFLVTAVPLLWIDGLRGFAVGVGVSTAVQLAVRAYYLSRLFEGFAFMRFVRRAVIPVLPAIAAVLLIRVAETGDRSLGVAFAELVLFLGITAAATWRLERPLLRETAGYVRGRPAAAG